ncbi:uncharacterized protein LOC105695591 [Orussus abietinus]|uniref:uncharacterized protein LOC105695591 n=1 Tax=Orussus abietinus TaxID=222816 RepID=UPI0006264F61|nr:uncharacterized protein LOC105695591 [Orussus abietinus]
MEFSSFDTLAMVVISIVFNWVTIANGINASISLHVEGLGFHRTFKYRVDVNEVSTETSCIALYFELPSALYVDPDELAGLLRLGKLIGCSQGETNVELFTEKAGPQNLTICSPISDMSSSTTFLLPIHRRYQFAKLNGTYAQIFLQRPRLFIGSVNKNEEHRVSVVNLCSPCTSISHKWLEIFYEFVSTPA